MADQCQDDDRPAKRQKCCNDLSPDVVENGNDPDVVENGNDPNVVENGNDPNVVENGNDPNVVENGNEPTSSCIAQDPKIVWTLEETLEGPERKIYEILKQRVQVYTYCEHPFSLKESMISEWWRKAAEELKDDQPDAKIRTTMTKSIIQSVSSSLC